MSMGSRLGHPLLSSSERKLDGGKWRTSLTSQLDGTGSAGSPMGEIQRCTSWRHGQRMCLKKRINHHVGQGPWRRRWRRRGRLTVPYVSSSCPDDVCSIFNLPMWMIKDDRPLASEGSAHRI